MSEYSDKTDAELISMMTSFRAHETIYSAARIEWERRKKERENQMMLMTENMVKVARYTLFIAMGSLIISIIAIFRSWR